MTNPTPHGQVPEALIDLIDAYAETEAARKAVIEALSGVQALSAAPGVTSEQRRLIGVIADKIEDGTLFQSGIYPKKDLARFVRNMLDTTPTAPAASPTPPVEQAAPKAAPAPLSDDTKRLDWLDRNIFSREMSEWDAKYGHGPDYNMWVVFSPKGVQGSARNIIDAALAAQGGKV